MNYKKILEDQLYTYLQTKLVGLNEDNLDAVLNECAAFMQRRMRHGYGITDIQLPPGVQFAQLANFRSEEGSITKEQLLLNIFYTFSLPPVKIPVSDSDFNEKDKLKLARDMIKKGIAVTQNYYRIVEDGKLKHYILHICIEEGDRGDSDGYGVEPDTWVTTYVYPDGSILSPFISEK